MIAECPVRPEFHAEAEADGDARRWFNEEVRPLAGQLKGFLGSQFPSIPDVEDVMQDAFVKLMRMRSRAQIRNTKGLLYHIARNEALNLIRRQMATPIIDVPYDLAIRVAGDFACAGELIDARQRLALLSDALATMSPVRAQILRLALQGVARPEIAELLGVSMNTVYSQISAGIQECRQFIAGRLKGSRCSSQGALWVAQTGPSAG